MRFRTFLFLLAVIATVGILLSVGARNGRQGAGVCPDCGGPLAIDRSLADIPEVEFYSCLKCGRVVSRSK